MNMLKMPWQFCRTCWYQGIGRAVRETHRYLAGRVPFISQPALRAICFPPTTPAAAYLPLLKRQPKIAVSCRPIIRCGSRKRSTAC